MRRILAILSGCFALACHAEDAPAMAEVTVHFGPKGGCTNEVVDRISHARAQVLVQAYSFTSKPIIEALVYAKRRGVDVQAVLDRKSAILAPSGKDALIAAGIPVTLDGVHAIAHNKIVIIDVAIVLTGSFNFSAAAEKSNAENLVTIRNAEVAALYLANWQKHAAHSEAVTVKRP